MRPRRVRLGYEETLAAYRAGMAASMRPRRVRLGYTAGRARMRLAYLGFNEAEARPPRILGTALMTMPADAALQ